MIAKKFLTIFMFLSIGIVFCEDAKDQMMINFIIKNNPDGVKACVMGGANPFKKNQDGESAVIIAMKYSRVEILKFFSSIKNKYEIKIVSPIEGLRLRSDHNIDAKILALIPQGEKVKCLDTYGDDIVIEKVSGKWVLVEWKEKFGWVFGGYLSSDENNNY